MKVKFAAIVLLVNFVLAIAYYSTSANKWPLGAIYAALAILIGASGLFLFRTRRIIDAPALMSITGTLLFWVPTLFEMTAPAGHFEGTANSLVDYSTYAGFALLIGSVLWELR